MCRKHWLLPKRKRAKRKTRKQWKTKKTKKKERTGRQGEPPKQQKKERKEGQNGKANKKHTHTHKQNASTTEKRKKREIHSEAQKKMEIHSSPIYANPLKNFPTKTLWHRNCSDFAIRGCDCDAHRGPQEWLAISETRQISAALRFKGVMESRQRFAISSCGFRAWSPLLLQDFRRFGSVSAEIASDLYDLGALIRSDLRTVALKAGDFSKKQSVVLVKCKDGCTKTIPWTENPGKIRRRTL